MTFRVGQKVVCIRASAGILYGETDAVVGHIYTVRGFFHFGDVAGIHLEEITNPPMDCSSGYHERYLACSRFRPLVERKPDISELKALLVPGARIKADA